MAPWGPAPAGGGRRSSGRAVAPSSGRSTGPSSTRTDGARGKRSTRLRFLAWRGSCRAAHGSEHPSATHPTPNIRDDERRRLWRAGLTASTDRLDRQRPNAAPSDSLPSPPSGCRGVGRRRKKGERSQSGKNWAGRQGRARIAEGGARGATDWERERKASGNKTRADEVRRPEYRIVPKPAHREGLNDSQAAGPRPRKRLPVAALFEKACATVWGTRSVSERTFGPDLISNRGFEWPFRDARTAAGTLVPTLRPARGVSATFCCPSPSP